MSATNLTNTPSIELPSLKRRLICLLYDAMLLFAIQFVAFWLPQTMIAVAFSLVLAPKWLFAHLLLISLLYLAYCWCRGGQTLALRTWKMQIVSQEQIGEQIRYLPVRPGQALLRFVLAIFSYGLMGIGIVWALFDRQQQFLHDRLAGTLIIHSRDSLSR